MVLLPRKRAISLECPNTVAGLVAKRAELLKLRTGLELELRAVTSDMDHIDATIRLSDPVNTPAARKRTERSTGRRGATSSGSCWTSSRLRRGRSLA